jgi:hypothetical protein
MEGIKTAGSFNAWEQVKEEASVKAVEFMTSLEGKGVEEKIGHLESKLNELEAGGNINRKLYQLLSNEKSYLEEDARRIKFDEGRASVMDEPRVAA